MQKLDTNRDEIVELASVLNKLIGDQDEDSLHDQASVIQTAMKSAFNAGYAAGFQSASFKIIETSKNE